MASKRDLYQTLAQESVANARWFLADAKRLRRVGSRGHGAAFGVLSIEESSKALIYRMVAEGVLRIVRRNPNHITTFTENELLNHQFKQQVLANAFGEYLRYGPFYEAAESLRKPKFSKTEVRELFSVRSTLIASCRSIFGAEVGRRKRSNDWAASWIASTT